jgi:hypothetical protein
VVAPDTRGRRGQQERRRPRPARYLMLKPAAFLPGVMDKDITGGRRQYFTPSGLVVLFDEPRRALEGQGWSRVPERPELPDHSWRV